MIEPKVTIYLNLLNTAELFLYVCHFKAGKYCYCFVKLVM